MTRKLFLNIFILAGLLITISVRAQSNEQKHFRLVYIGHEEKTQPEKTGELCEKLITLHNNVLETGDGLIIYLSNEDTPLISLTNLSGLTKTSEGDGLASFEDIIFYIQNYSSLKVSAEHDRKNLIELLSRRFPIADAQRRLRFKSVVLDFYVGPRFWQLRYNERLIAQLFGSLSMRNLMEKYRSITQLQFNVWKAKGDNLNHLPGKPFGISNLDGINDKVRISEY